MYGFGKWELESLPYRVFELLPKKRPCGVDVLATLGPGGGSSFVRASLKALIVSARSVSFFLAEGPNSSPPVSPNSSEQTSFRKEARRGLEDFTLSIIVILRLVEM